MTTCPIRKKDVLTRWDGPEANRLVQLSGARYSFDPHLPEGERIVWSDLQPDRIYMVVMSGEVVERETILLAGRFITGMLRSQAESKPASRGGSARLKSPTRIVSAR